MMDDLFATLDIDIYNHTFITLSPGFNIKKKVTLSVLPSWYDLELLHTTVQRSFLLSYIHFGVRNISTDQKRQDTE